MQTHITTKADKALTIERKAQHTEDGPEVTLYMSATLDAGFDSKSFKATRQTLRQVLKDIMTWLRKLAIEYRPERIIRLFNLDGV